jgi:hypothetical protein
MSESDLRSNIFQPLRDLTEKSNRLLIQCLDTDLDLGLTFCDTARIENVLRDVSGTDAALQNAGAADGCYCVDRDCGNDPAVHMIRKGQAQSPKTISTRRHGSLAPCSASIRHSHPHGIRRDHWPLKLVATLPVFGPNGREGVELAVPCVECDRLSKLEIECTRRAENAYGHLRSFVPEPPYGAAAAAAFQHCEQAAENCRASVEEARRKRVAHGQTHALTVLR